MPSTIVQAAVYCRISDDREGKGLGVERQREDCEALALQLGWQVSDVLVDNDMSAYSGKKRPGYERLLAGLETGTFNAILAWHTDRLHRSPVELEGFIGTVERLKVQIRTVQGGELDLSTASGRMVARMLGSAARYESDMKSDRIRRKHLALAREGQPIKGGHRCFGYERDLTINQAEATIVRDLMRRALLGESMGSLVRSLNDEGITTTTGKQWRTATLQRFLCTARIAGWRSHSPGAKGGSNELRFGGPFTTDGVWEGIVSRAEVEQLRARLKSGRSRRGAPRKYLLSGVLTCGAQDVDGKTCGAGMLGSPSGTKQPDGRFARRYICVTPPVGRGCGHMFVRADEVEAEVIEQTRAALDNPALAERMQRQDRPDAEAITQQLARDEAALTQLGIDLDDETISRSEWSDRRARLQDRISAARAELADVEAFPVLKGFLGGTEAFDRAWSEASDDVRRGVVLSVLNGVKVLPAVRGRNRFDPDRLVPDWRT